MRGTMLRWVRIIIIGVHEGMSSRGLEAQEGRANPPGAPDQGKIRLQAYVAGDLGCARAVLGSLVPET